MRIGYKKVNICNNGAWYYGIVKLEILGRTTWQGRKKGQRRPRALYTKCRTAKAKVLSIMRLERHRTGQKALKLRVKDRAISMHDRDFVYKVGAIVEPTQPFDPSPRNECTSGIHFFFDEDEARNY